MNTSLSDSELTRYDRQMMIPDWGKDGQKKLKEATVLVAGTGGLGCPVSLYLAAAGVGRLVLVDKDKFELSNLNRQILGWQENIGQAKAEAVAKKLVALNPNVKIDAHATTIREDNVAELLNGANVVVDAMDNWTTRFLLNQECVNQDKPLVHAGIYGLNGQVTTIIPRKGPCLRCILPDTPREISTFPVIGATPGLFAMLQVMEVLKLIVGFGETLVGRLLLFDGERMDYASTSVQRRNNCPVCSDI
ncbi:HesA/MoeB/ThiF family protein [Candidatus Thorarchaeota archaeon]|nr:MAG: HesA/MoeB/ThiF family protein [Candidatus Thorarchaeota archaeon]